MTAKAQIIEAINERWPGHDRLPFGALTALADEFGVSKEMARLAAKSIGRSGNRKTLLLTVICDNCDEPFLVGRWADRRFCTKQCANIGLRTHHPQHLDCPVCGDPFVWTVASQHYRRHNVKEGRIKSPDAPPCCSRPCAVTQGRRLGKAARGA